jgi:hypothetical protein
VATEPPHQCDSTRPDTSVASQAAEPALNLRASLDVVVVHSSAIITTMVSLRRFAVGVILAVCIGAPILEMVDQWDHTLQDGNDTEVNLVVVALCVGVAFSVAGAIIACVRPSARAQGGLVLVSESMVRPLLTFAAPIPNSSPPTALRV